MSRDAILLGRNRENLEALATAFPDVRSSHFYRGGTSLAAPPSAEGQLATKSEPGFFLYHGTGMSEQDVQRLAVSANGRAAVEKTVAAMQDRIRSGRQVNSADGHRLSESWSGSLLNLTKSQAADNPYYWTQKGRAENNNYSWVMRGEFTPHVDNPTTVQIEVDWCSPSGCSLLDGVVGTRVVTTMAPGGSKIVAELRDIRNSDYITQVHFQSYVYAGGRNVTVSWNCNGEPCHNTENWDSGKRTWGVAARPTTEYQLTRLPIRLWGYHAQRNVWVSAVGSSGDAKCGKTGDLCKFY